MYVCRECDSTRKGGRGGRGGEGGEGGEGRGGRGSRTAPPNRPWGSFMGSHRGTPPPPPPTMALLRVVSGEGIKRWGIEGIRIGTSDRFGRGRGELLRPLQYSTKNRKRTGFGPYSIAPKTERGQGLGFRVMELSPFNRKASTLTLLGML